MKFHFKALVALAGIAAGTVSCIVDDLSDCPDPWPGTDLRFVFTHHDHTDEPTDLFAGHVGDVHLYIFDSHDMYVTSVAARQTDLDGGNTLSLDLDEGRYKIVVWGNLYATGYEVDTPEGSDRGAFSVSATDNHNTIEDLFHGMADITVGEERETYEVPLIRNTHYVRVNLLGLPAPSSRTPVDESDYEVAILGSNTVYNFDNHPAGGTAATYIPEYSGYTYEESYVVQAEFKVQRLLLGEDVRLLITDGDNVLKDDDLPARIAYAYTEIETDSDLDKHYVYELYYELDYFGGWIFVGNNIKDWSGTTQPGEL